MHDAKVMARNAAASRDLALDNEIADFTKTAEGRRWEKFLVARREIERGLPTLVQSAAFNPKARPPKEN